MLVKANPISRKTAIRKKKKKKRTFTSEKPCYERDLERSSPWEMQFKAKMPILLGKIGALEVHWSEKTQFLEKVLNLFLL